MQVAEAQAEVREMYIGGSIGAMVSATVWLIAAAMWTWSSPRLGMLSLIFGGMLIFPVGQGVLLLMGRHASLPASNPFKALAMQIAFTLPLTIPLVLAATAARPEWFFPGMMLIVGVHYLPFITLYGMCEYGVITAVLVAGALIIGIHFPEHGVVAGWLTATAEMLFGGIVLLREWESGRRGILLSQRS